MTTQNGDREAGQREPDERVREAQRDDHPTEGLLTTQLVFDKLYEWRSSLWLDEDGEALPLVDILTPDNEPTIGPAREELWSLADHVAAELDAALAASKEPPDSMGHGQPIPSLSGGASVADQKDAAVYAELDKAIAKFPTWPTDALHALGVVGEEFGELTKEVLQLTYEPHKTSFYKVSKEAVQTAAMALRFVRSLSRYTFHPGEQHEQA